MLACCHICTWWYFELCRQYWRVVKPWKEGIFSLTLLRSVVHQCKSDSELDISQWKRFWTEDSRPNHQICTETCWINGLGSSECWAARYDQWIWCHCWCCRPNAGTPRTGSGKTAFIKGFNKNDDEDNVSFCSCDVISWSKNVAKLSWIYLLYEYVQVSWCMSWGKWWSGTDPEWLDGVF